MLNFNHWLSLSHSEPRITQLPALTIGYSEQEAVVEDVIQQGRLWRVRYKASFWKARSIHPNTTFFPKDVVHVVGRQNLVLLIKSTSEE